MTGFGARSGGRECRLLGRGGREPGRDSYSELQTRKRRPARTQVAGLAVDRSPMILLISRQPGTAGSA